MARPGIRGTGTSATPALGPGAEVGRRQHIGYVGATGDVTGPHLHFALSSSSGVPPGYGACGSAGTVDPIAFINARRSVGVSEGSFVSTPDGRVYRVAGGAPIYVSHWDAVGGPQPTTSISFEHLKAMRPWPADGTFISSTASGRVYKVAGGAPIYVSNWDAVGGPQASIGIDQWALDNITDPHAHLRAWPVDGTFVSSTASGRVYKVAGGAPIYVSNWDAVGGPQASVGIDQWALDNITDPHAHLNLVPADGSFISSTATGRVYRVAGGAPIYVSNWNAVGGPQPSVGIDQWALDNITDPHAHLNARPTDGTLLGSSAGGVFVAAGGAPLYVSTWDAVGGPRPVVPIDEWAIQNTSDPNAHLSPYPADGTFLNTSSGRVYRVAGGAPFYVSDWGLFGGVRPYVAVDQWVIDHASEPAAHVRQRPVDGTVVKGLPSLAYWSFNGGVRSRSESSGAAVEVDDVGLADFPAAPATGGGLGEDTRGASSRCREARQRARRARRLVRRARQQAHNALGPRAQRRARRLLAKRQRELRRARARVMRACRS